MTQKIINGMPHPVYLLGKDKKVLRTFPKSNSMIRVDETVEEIKTIDGIPITSTSWIAAKGTPPYKEGIYYIVNQLVKNALPDRKDFLVPKGAVKDKSGVVIGCTRLDVGDLKSE